MSAILVDCSYERQKSRSNFKTKKARFFAQMCFSMWLLDFVLSMENSKKDFFFLAEKIHNNVICLKASMRIYQLR